MNLLRRHLDPLAWGKALKKLLKLHGVKREKGGDRRSTTANVVDTVKSVAAVVGVPQSHYRWPTDTSAKRPRQER